MQTGGHHAAFLRHVVTHWPEMAEGQAVVVAASETVEALQPRVSSARVSLHATTPSRSGAGWWATRQTARAFEEALTRYQPRRTFSFYANALTFRRRAVRAAPRLRSILMRPVTPLDRPYGRRFSIRVHRWRRQVATRWWGKQAQAERVFLLNDAEGAARLNQQWRTNVFHALPDPLPTRPSEKAGATKKPGVYRFLLPGGYARRKGGEAVLAALALLTDAERAQIEVCFLGKPTVPADARCLQRLEQQWAARGMNLPVTYAWDDVDDAAWMAAFDTCDAVLLPYVDFHGSSGVMVEAAAAGKPILSTGENLLGRLVEAHGLGRTVNPHDALAFAQAIRQMLAGDHRVVPAQRTLWLERSQGQDFMRHLLAA